MISLYERRDYGPERVATNILRAVEKNRGVAPITPEAWAFYYLKRWCPGLLRWVSRVSRERGRKRLGLSQ